LQGGAWAGVAGAGLRFPVDLSAQIHGLTMSLRPLEVFANVSFAWILYFGLSALAGALLTGVIATALLLLRRYDDRAVRRTGHIIIALLLAKVFFEQAVRFASVVRNHGSWTYIGIVLVAAWLVIRHAAILDRVRGFLATVTTVGAIVAGVTIVSAFVGLRFGPDGGRPPANRPRTNLILITIDTLAANHMSLYGYFRDTTPSLNKFAQQVFVFDRHYTNGNFTTPSIESILTGTRPWVHRVFQLHSRPQPYIAQLGLIPTLKRSGYSTMAVATNPCAMPELHRIAGSIDRERVARVEPIEFKELQWFPTFGSVFFFPTLERIQRIYTRFIYRNYTSNLHFDPELAFAEARALLATESRKDIPKFLWVHLFPPHEPYAAPAPFLRSFDPSDRALTLNDSRPPAHFAARTYPGFPGVFSARYDEAIRYVDYHIGCFLKWLKREGYYEDSLIIVTADHGESFAHNYANHAGPMLYEDLIHVPLLVKLPGQHTGSRIQDIATEHADLFPTILDCLHLPASGRLEGRSLLPAMDGRTLPPHPVYAMNFEENSVFGPLQNGSVALVNERYKYVRHLGRVSYLNMPTLEDELYDVINDPAENADLKATRPEIAVSMRSAIDAAVSQHSLP
jgi:arylsulfatase A-like enzyme